MLLIAGVYLSIRTNLHSLPWLLAAATNFTLSAFVLLQDPKNKLNRSYALFSAAIAVWCMNSFVLFIVPNEHSAKLYGILFSIGMIMTPPLFYSFTLRLSENRSIFNVRMMYLAFIIAGVYAVLSYSGAMTDEFIRLGWKYSPRTTPLYTAFMVYSAFILLFGIYQILKSYRTSLSLRVKNQMKFVLAAAAIGSLFAVSNYILSFGINFYPVGAFGVIAYSLIVAYAILKYQLMNIQVIVRKGLIYGALSFTIVSIYAALVGIASGVLAITGASSGMEWLLHSLAGAMAALIFLQVKDRVQDFVDRIFFKDKYDYSGILLDFSRELTYIHNLQGLLVLLVHRVTSIMHIDKGCVMLYDEDGGGYRSLYASGSFGHKIEHFVVDKRSAVVEQLKSGEPVMGGASYGGGSMGEFDLHGIEIVFPLLTKNKLIGMFCVGKKLSEDLYTYDDIELLGIVSNQAAAAIDSIGVSMELRSLEKDLYRADKLSALGTLSSSIAHEIKNPLASVKAFCQLLPRRKADDGFIDNFNKIVPQEIERMERILGQLLGFVRAGGRGKDVVEIRGAIENVLEIMSYQIFKQNITVSKEIEEREEIRVFAPLDELKQVFMNIILNAIQAMPSGGKLSISAKIQEGKDAFITIADTGGGMDETVRSKIFKPFFTTKLEGTGLGLSIVKKIIKELNGDVKVESESGKGTRFIIRLPLSK